MTQFDKTQWGLVLKGTLVLALGWASWVSAEMIGVKIWTARADANSYTVQDARTDFGAVEIRLDQKADSTNITRILEKLAEAQVECATELARLRVLIETGIR